MRKRSLLYVAGLTIMCLFAGLRLYAQNIGISGTVKDEQGLPLPAVTIMEKGTRQVVKTDASGNYKITLTSPRPVLVFSYVGFTKQERSIDGKATVLNITLKEDATGLNEVVIIGYQSVTKKKNTAAISSISGKELENIPSASFDMILQGRLAGLNVQSVSGSPGSASTVYVRGSTGISDTYDQAAILSSPLYVIDGVPQPTEQYSNINTGTGTNYLAGLNPNDIESLQVLRDASAAAIYGSRAANGVILITTKKGTGGAPKVIINGYSGLTLRPDLRPVALGSTERNQKLSVLNSQATYAQLIDLPYLLTDSINPAFNGHTDWQDIFYQRGLVRNGDLSMSGGGNGGMTYRFSAGYYDEDGIIKATGFKRFSSRLNLVSNAMNERLTINPIISFTNMNKARGNGDETSVFPISAGSLPTSLLNLSEKRKAFYLGTYDEDLDKNITNQLSLNLNLNLKILPYLTLTSQTSYGYNTAKRDLNRPSALNSNLGNYSLSFQSAQENWMTSNYLNYTSSFGKHSLTVLAGQDIQYDKYQVTDARGDYGTSDQVKVVQGFLQDNIYAYSDYQAWGLLSYYTRLSYDFDSRYIFSGSLRTDGSSRFGKNNRWGYFPSASVAWLLSEESFLKDNENISLLKVRASYGSTGNLPRDNYLQYNVYRVNTAGYAGNTSAASYNGVSATVPNFNNGVAQNDLTWEKSESWNIGTDIELYHGKYTISADIYNKETKGQLFSVQLPVTSGYNYANTNSVGIRNSGVELILNVSPLAKASKIDWKSNFNISYNKNRIMNLPNGGRDLVMSGDRFDKSHILSVGSPINAFYLYRTMGVYRTINDVPVNPYNGVLLGSPGAYGAGMFHLDDLNSDYKIDPFNSGINPDKLPVGDPNPKWTGGWNNTFSYKKFSLSFFINFTLNRDILNLYEADVLGQNAAGDFQSLAFNTIPDLSKLDIWRQDGDQAEYAKLDIGTYRYYYTSAQTFFLENGSYVRLKNIIGSYEFNSKRLAGIGINRLRVYGIIDNALTWKSSKKLPDPESVNQYGEYNGNGYPVPRKFTLGFEITL